MPQKYRFTQTDELVEALQVDKETVKIIADWCHGKDVEEIDAIHAERRFPAVNVPTLNGVVRAQEGSWVLRRPEGDFYVRGHQNFARFYVKVDEPAEPYPGDAETELRELGRFFGKPRLGS